MPENVVIIRLADNIPDINFLDDVTLVYPLPPPHFEICFLFFHYNPSFLFCFYSTICYNNLTNINLCLYYTLFLIYVNAGI